MFKKSKIKTIIVKNEKKISLDDLMKDLQGKYGEGVIMKLGDARRVNIDSISTGALSLDLALGVGGVPKGRIIEIFGSESCGKTTLALHIVAETQKKKGIAAFIDAEHALDPEYAKKIGVDIDNLLISQPDTGEDALDILETLVRSGTVSVVIIDSVAALTPKAEIEGEMGDQQIGLQARLMSKALRKITSVAAKNGVIIIFINQVRTKIGIMWGDPDVTPGGKALKFYSSVRIKLTRTAKIERNGQVVGNRVKAKIVKNKVAPPFRGISRLSDLVRMAEKYGVVTKKGSSYSYNGKSIGSGIEGAKKWIKEDSKRLEEITEKTKQKFYESLE
ncbi:MAG: Protein RecA [Candidatus Roizmanbacteria bacterium GW2011_GWA2_32_13]|uniref:Protein RecA n=1 Tax=Candidatus Roizmanbacteria bacterium GW2011_GWA2_32_13 TaxID=1618475 RepID=A0A0F9YPW0_9BACT|nr:MAG: Protein RecA [Candidatus Roizmanbacteria bacterium GW2011_GWA2_32_13]